MTIDYFTIMSLADGRDIYEITGEMIVNTTCTAEDVRKARMSVPESYPRLPREAGGYAYWARRIVANLLNAGWTPPSEETIAAEIATQQALSEWFKKHRKDPCRCGHDVNAHIGEGDQCVDCQHIDGTECWTWRPESQPPTALSTCEVFDCDKPATADLLFYDLCDEHAADQARTRAEWRNR